MHIVRMCSRYLGFAVAGRCKGMESSCQHSHSAGDYIPWPHLHALVQRAVRVSRVRSQKRNPASLERTTWRVPSSPSFYAAVRRSGKTSDWRICNMTLQDWHLNPINYVIWGGPDLRHHMLIQSMPSMVAKSQMDSHCVVWWCELAPRLRHIIAGLREIHRWHTYPAMIIKAII